MDFRFKCFIQQIFSNLPKGEVINYQFQKRVSKNLPVSNEFFKGKVLHAKAHYEQFRKHEKIENKGGEYYEFGAGWDLVGPISMSLLSFKVTCIDIRPLKFNELIYNSLNRFNSLKSQLPIEWKEDIEQPKNENEVMRLLEKNYGFQYLAPKDARSTNFQSNMFDFASSTNTFEHIPKKDILPILNETYRILKPGGILSLIIDYRDHWAFFDQRIGIFNYLKYSQNQWKKYNPSLHYQNRLRHIDYLNMIKNTDFEIVHENPYQPNEKERNSLKNLELHSDYESYTMEDLAVKGAQIVLRKPMN